MKIHIAVFLSVFLVAGSAYAGEQFELKDDKDKESYSIGINIGNSLKKQSLDIRLDPLTQGLRDAFSDEEKLMTDQEVNQTLRRLQGEITAQRTAEKRAIAEKNKAASEAFLNENKEKEGVITLPSGLQYRVIKEGDKDAESPSVSDTVLVHYKGMLIDGTEFDSSYTRGEPATFRVNGVIPGMTEALQLMKTGAKWELFIPPDLGYGERGAGRLIGSNQTLVFELELISFEEGMKFHTDEILP